uniref:ferric-chelate reductase (NADPH) n=1 Tax=Ganoderma boninense TaxID=34458 RepID=A0A5K1K410_9APHY|nr:Pre-mRNA-splicing ATP-dependent RNA helicase PRP28 (EC [Ganoderma boninense]
MSSSTPDMSQLLDRFHVYNPSKDDSHFREAQQKEAVRRMWVLIASVVAFLFAVRVLRFTLSLLFDFLFCASEEPMLAIRKDGKASSQEIVLPGRNGRASWRRIPSACASGFRIIFFRVQVPLLVGAASIAELFFVFGYIAAMLSLTFTNTKDLNYWFYQDRGAHLAACQLPFIVALAGKNNIISFLTGIGHEKLNVLHRAAARTCLILLWIHALTRTVAGLTEREDFGHGWMRWGAASLTSFTLLSMMSVRIIRILFFEFFLMTHIFLVGEFLHDLAARLGGHSLTIYICSYGDYFWPALVVWAFDRILRTTRLVWNNRGRGGRHHEYGSAVIELVSSDTVRMTLRRKMDWRAGQHAYVVLPTISDIPSEAHPFTIASIPEQSSLDESGERDVVFLIRARGGFTGRLSEHATSNGVCRVPAFIDGPYGCPPDLTRFSTCILIAGGSGVSYTLPHLLNLVRRVIFIWAVRESDHLGWISKSLCEALAVAQSTPLAIEPSVYVTGPTCDIPRIPGTQYAGSEASGSDSGEAAGKELPLYSSLKIVHGRPSIRRILQEGVDGSSGPVSVDVSGPSSLTASVSSALASKLTSPANILKASRTPSDSPLVPTFHLFGDCAMSSDLLHPLHYLTTIEEVASSTPSPVSNHPSMHDEEDEEEFVYPGTEGNSSAALTDDQEESAAAFEYGSQTAFENETETAFDNESEAAFEYEPEATFEYNPPEERRQTPKQEHQQLLVSPSPRAVSPPPPLTEASGPAVQPTAPSPVPARHHPSPAQLEALHAAAASGDLRRVQTEFRSAVRADDVEPFELTNDASPRTGLTALHAAASRGWLDIVKWLVEECGAIPDIEDKEGETALHKAALNGHLDVVKYLLPGKADVHAKDADGWTALHNACSKGYLDIVRWLCESGGATSEIDGAPGVDVRSKGGWTPLMNASSKGHLPVVLYLLTKQQADPLVRNNWGETAYDVAAAVFEIWVLQRFESEKWRDSSVPFNPLGVHTTVPLVLYENQRLDVRLKTLAVSGGRPKFSASGLGRRGRQAPFELVLPVASESNGKRVGRIGRWTLRLLVLTLKKGGSTPTRLVMPTTSGYPSLRPNLNDSSTAVAQSPSAWLAEAPEVEAAPMEARVPARILHMRSIYPRCRSSSPDGAMYHLADGQLIPYVEHGDGESDFGGSDGQEMSAMPTLGLGSQDYVARARYLVGTPHPDDGDMSSALEARRMIAKLERATTELRQGLLGDDDHERKIQAEVLLNAYNRELERRRLAAGAQGLLISGDDGVDIDDDDDDEEFHYPGASPLDTSTARAPSIRSTTTDYFGRATSSSSRGPTDLTPHLSQAPEFRVPTHEAPQKVLTPRWSASSPHSLHATWERDEHVTAAIAGAYSVTAAHLTGSSSILPTSSMTRPSQMRLQGQASNVSAKVATKKSPQRYPLA